MIKRFFILSAITILALVNNYSQKNEVYFKYGGSFTGAGDLQGRGIGIGYQRDIFKKLSFFTHVEQASMTGQSVGAFFLLGNTMIGSDGISFSQLDIFDIDKQNKISSAIQSGSKRHIPGYAMTNNKTLHTGLRFFPVRKSKLHVFLEGNIGLSKLEMTYVTKQQLVYIEDPIFGQVSNDDFKINTQTQDNLLDFGYGYGLGVKYFIKDRVSVGAHANFTQYIKDAQNILTWSFLAGFRF
jgi:opacity protein-like surface antigen